MIRRLATSYPVLAGAAFALLAVVMTWPMALEPGSLFNGRQDFYLNTWILWWVARVFGEGGLELFFSAEVYFPKGSGLESQPFTLIQTLPVAPITLRHGPVVAYNLLAVFSFWFAGWAAALWIRDLTGSALAGLFGGVLFDFAPYHYLYLPQLGMVAIGFFPLFLWADRRYTHRPTVGRAAGAGLALAATAFGAWYYGIIAGLTAAGLSLARLWQSEVPWRRRLSLEAVFAGTWLLALLPLLVALLPVFGSADYAQGGEERSGMALVMEAFKGTAVTVGLWSYIGFTALAFAALGLRQLRGRVAVLVMTVAFLLLSMGEELSLFGLSLPGPYRILDALPAVNAIRFPDRFFVLVQLGVAGLAGCGLAQLSSSGRLGQRAAWIFVLVALVELYPGPFTAVPVTEVLPVPVAGEGRPGAVLHVPTHYRNLDGENLYHLTRHGRPITGGYLTRPNPELVESLQAERPWGLLARPDPGAVRADLVEALRADGFAYVCVQRAPLVPPVPEEPGTFFGPFAWTGRAWLEQRLFPVYPPHARLKRTAERTEARLREVLGPPLAENRLAAVFAVPGP